MLYLAVIHTSTKEMFIRICLPLAAASLLYSNFIRAQQFNGFSPAGQPTVQQMPYNPARVCGADDGMEINLFSAGVLLHTNAYSFYKDGVLQKLSGNGTITEGEDYTKTISDNTKYLRGNVDVLGPAVSCRVRPNIFGGIYLRTRQLVNGGNLPATALSFIGDRSQAVTGQPVSLSKTGFTMHAFSEFGFTVGTVLKDDGYHRWHAGATVKYLIGTYAGSVYTGNTEMMLKTRDSIAYLKGDLSAKFSRNSDKATDHEVNNDMAAWFDPSGHRSLGLDLGVQYEYHPDYDPNHETPYLYRVSASITDIGSIKYDADTGSGMYDLHLKNRADWQYSRRDYEPNSLYLLRLAEDTSMMRRKDSITSFRVGLPAAFRLNADVNLGNGFYWATDILLNLKGSKNGIYKPGYTSALTFTPRYERKWLMIALPFTLYNTRQVTAGVALRVGPLFAGSSSLISCAVSKHINTLDGYAGISFKFRRKQQSY